MDRPTVATSSVPDARLTTLSTRISQVLRRLPAAPTFGDVRRAARYTVGYAFWGLLALDRILHLVAKPDGVDNLRASGIYNAVPGWLGPGAWLAYCVTTYTALARAVAAIRAATRIRVEVAVLQDIEPGPDDDADEVWDPDLTTSALFTVFAWVALLSGSRGSADVDANMLVLSAIAGAVAVGFFVGQLGGVLWVSVLWRLQLPTGQLPSPCPLARTAFRRLMIYFVMALGSASVLLVFNRRMGTRVLPQIDPSARDPFILSLQDDFRGSMGRGDWFIIPERLISAYGLFFVLNMHKNPLWRDKWVNRYIVLPGIFNLYKPFLVTAGEHVLSVPLMVFPGTACFPNSAISIMEPDQLGPLVTVGIITAVRMVYFLRKWHRRHRRDTVRVTEETLQPLPEMSLPR